MTYTTRRPLKSIALASIIFAADVLGRGRWAGVADRAADRQQPRGRGQSGQRSRPLRPAGTMLPLKAQGDAMRSSLLRSCSGNVRLAATAVLLLLMASPASASPTETPEAYIARSLDAVRADGMGAVADFMHPDEGARVRAKAAPLFDLQDTDGKEVRNVFGEQSMAALPPLEFMRVFLHDAFGNTEKVAALRIGQPQMLGSVREGDVVHVVMRGAFQARGVDVTRLQVISVRPNGDGWGLLLTGDLEELAERMHAVTAGYRALRALQSASQEK